MADRPARGADGRLLRPLRRRCIPRGDSHRGRRRRDLRVRRQLPRPDRFVRSLVARARLPLRQQRDLPLRFVGRLRRTMFPSGGEPTHPPFGSWGDAPHPLPTEDRFACAGNRPRRRLRGGGASGPRLATRWIDGACPHTPMDLPSNDGDRSHFRKTGRGAGPHRSKGQVGGLPRVTARQRRDAVSYPTAAVSRDSSRAKT